MVEKIKNLIEQPITEKGYILDSVSYEKEAGVNTLLVVIDKPGIIDVEDCVTVSNIVNPILDEYDPISESYVLDVCSKEKGSDYDE